MPDNLPQCAQNLCVHVARVGTVLQSGCTKLRSGLPLVWGALPHTAVDTLQCFLKAWSVETRTPLLRLTQSAAPEPQRAQGCQCMCVDCGRSFGSLSGLGVHRWKAHPLVFHASNRPVRVKAQRDDKVVYAMAVHEAQLMRDGVNLINQP